MAEPNKKIKLKYDTPITIATGKSRKDTQWKNKELLWSQFVEIKPDYPNS